MKRLLLLLLLGSRLARAGTGHEDADAPAAEGASFKEGQGITLSEETRNAIGLEVVDVAEGTLTPERRVMAQVYRTAGEASQNSGEISGRAYASAVIPSATAEGLKENAAIELPGLTATGRVVAVERTMQAAANQCEVLIEIPDPDAQLALGDFVDGNLAEGPGAMVLRVPRSAILESASGTYAFVLNGTALLRTPVTTGARDAVHVEIVEGLYAGDAVAATAVEMLYLIELQATKGGVGCCGTGPTP